MDVSTLMDAGCANKVGASESTWIYGAI